VSEASWKTMAFVPPASPESDVGGSGARDVAALEGDAAARRGEEVREQIEARRLAGPVGADERVDRAAPDAEGDVAHRDETAELLGEPLGLQDRVIHLSVCPPPTWVA
jgi:hypothetical protein